MIRHLLSPFVLILAVFFSSCSSEEQEEVVITEFDQRYIGVSTDEGALVGVWDISILDGAITGSTTYIDGEEAVSVNLNGAVKGSGAFDLTVNYRYGYSGLIEGLLNGYGSVSGSWENSDGSFGVISGKILENEYQLYNGSYSGAVTNSDFVWNFTIKNGIAEGRFNNQAFAGLIGLEGATIKLLEVEVLVDSGPVVVSFGITEEGEVSGNWYHANDTSRGGVGSGSES